MTKTSFAAELRAATAEAFDQLKAKVGRDPLYAFALYTSGESDFSYVCASGNTERHGKDDGVRWSAPDWHYHDCSERVAALELPANDKAVYAAMAAALRALRPRARGVMLLILCGDMSNDFFRRGLKLLNPPAMVKAYLARYTPEAFLKRLARLPRAKRQATLLGLWRDLILERRSPLADEARAAGAHQYTIEPLIEALGRPALDPLLDLVEAHAFAEPFNEKGSPEWKRHGSSSRPDWLRSAALSVIGEIGGLDEAQVGRLRTLLGKVAARDARRKGHVATLAANIASVLHAHAPDRFPRPDMSDTTNHLRNAAAYTGPRGAVRR